MSPDSLSNLDIPARQLLKAAENLLNFHIARNDNPDRLIVDLIKKKYQSYLQKHVIDSARFGDSKAALLTFHKVLADTYLN